MTRAGNDSGYCPRYAHFFCRSACKTKANMAAEMEMEAAEMAAEGPEPERAENGLIPALHEHDISPIPGG